MAGKVFDIIEPPRRSGNIPRRSQSVTFHSTPIQAAVLAPQKQVESNFSPTLAVTEDPGVDSIFAKEMSRKEFLLTIGVGITSLMGLSSALSLLWQKPQNAQLTQNSYSSGPYGGYKA